MATQINHVYTYGDWNGKDNKNQVGAGKSFLYGVLGGITGGNYSLGMGTGCFGNQLGNLLCGGMGYGGYGIGGFGCNDNYMWAQVGAIGVYSIVSLISGAVADHKAAKAEKEKK